MTIEATQAQFGTEYLLNRIGAGAARTYPRFEVESCEQHHKDTIDVFIGNVKDLFEAYYFETRAIESNVNLSAEGKFNATEPIQKKTNVAFNRITDRCRNLQNEHMSKVEKVFNTTPPEINKTDAVLTFLQMTEIRTFLLKKPLTDRVNIFLTSNDPAVFNAIETAPDIFEMLPPDILKRAKIARVMRLHGSLLEPLEDERLCLERINFMLNAVPGVFKWITITPNLWPLPESVYPEVEKEESADITADPVKSLVLKPIGQ